MEDAVDREGDAKVGQLAGGVPTWQGWPCHRPELCLPHAFASFTEPCTGMLMPLVLPLATIGMA